MRVLGIDPGLTTTGLGVVERSTREPLRALDWLSIETSPTLPLPTRLTELARDLEAFLATVTVDLAVVERLFIATNKRTAMDVAQARGVILLTLAQRGIPIIEVSPLQLKMGITGDGRADKRQVQTMVQRILKLPTLPTPVDAADALALAMYGAEPSVAMSVAQSTHDPHRTQPHGAARARRAQL